MKLVIYIFFASLLFFAGLTLAVQRQVVLR